MRCMVLCHEQEATADTLPTRGTPHDEILQIQSVITSVGPNCTAILDQSERTNEVVVDEGHINLLCGNRRGIVICESPISAWPHHSHATALEPLGDFLEQIDISFEVLGISRNHAKI